MSWQTRSSRIAYENPWMRVREDRVTRPDGEAGLYGVIEVPHPAVFVVALTDADEVLLVEVDRYTVGPSLEIPAGGSDGEPRVQAAQRELREETGYEASEWRELGGMTALNGIARAQEHVFLATGLRRAADDRPETRRHEGISAVRAVPWAAVLQMISDGTISDGESIAALFHAAIGLGRVS